MSLLQKRESSFAYIIFPKESLNPYMNKISIALTKAVGASIRAVKFMCFPGGKGYFFFFFFLSGPYP